MWDASSRKREPEDHDHNLPSSSAIPRTRASKACDNCRQVRRKCEPNVPGGPCKSCAAASIECIFSQPSRQRGPPKGYLRTVESRLHEMEATLGLIQSIPDLNVQSLLEDISQDPYAKHILDRVRQSPFGPDGRPPRTDGVEPSSSSSSGRGTAHEANPFVEGPTNQWQEQVVGRFMERVSQARASAAAGQQLAAGSAVLPPNQPSYPGPSRLSETQQHQQPIQQPIRAVPISSQGHHTRVPSGFQAQQPGYHTSPHGSAPTFAQSPVPDNLYSLFEGVFPDNPEDVESLTDVDEWRHPGDEGQ